MSTKPSGSSGRSWSLTTLAVALGVIVADQFTKSLAEAHVGETPHHVIGPFGLELTYNTGSSFSLFQGSSGPLALLSIGLIVVLGVVGVRAKEAPLRFGIGLMMGGAAGNLLDRAFRNHHGGVVDFITLSHWPTFNLADSAITVGTAVVIITLLRDFLGTRTTDRES